MVRFIRIPVVLSLAVVIAATFGVRGPYAATASATVRTLLPRDIASPGLRIRTPSNVLGTGQRLHIGQAQQPGIDVLTSPSGNCTFTLYQPSATTVAAEIDMRDAYVVDGLWHAMYGIGDAGSFLTVQSDGNVVEYGNGGHVVWASHTSGTGNSNRLVLQDDGDMVLYTASGRAVWSTQTHRDTIVAGQQLAPGQYLKDKLTESTQPSTLVMQPDGDLVVRYGTKAVWSSHTHAAGAFLVMQADGNAVIYSGSRPLWSTKTSLRGSDPGSQPILYVRDEFMFVDKMPGVYGGHEQTMWSSE